ncbi:transcriptional regulator [Devosia pacifica]|uniref:Transcriptional regulator n=1 Tax=Devosia pacifica TaxID=1335967 RepID=A0A918S346_9HYPH|nr:LacI family DNA-binding transcriptional regulator [Devosia pacifica]GHA22468.1 transcriptional regulator [Devosia pacifica]
MTPPDRKRRATVHDVAQAAGVSLATVDRVLNGRAGVRPRTAERVTEAIESLGFRRDLGASLLARARAFHLVFLIPDGDNAFMDSLAAAVARQAAMVRTDRMSLTTQRFHALDATALAEALDRLSTRNCDAVAVVATDEPVVQAAIDAAVARGLVVVTLVSDLPQARRHRFIGIDNLAAGRTAASLLGRFCPGGGTVGVVVGSLRLRDHAERLEGFRAVIASDFDGLELLEPREGHDDSSETEGVTAQLFADNPQLTGLYNIGAGNTGLMAALEKINGPLPRTIVHELTPPTREGVMRGLVDVVLDQNPTAEIRAAILAARAQLLGAAGPDLIDPIEIGLFLRDNLRRGDYQTD